MKLCDECKIRKPRGMYSKNGVVKQYCMFCFTKLFPDMAKIMTESTSRIVEQYNESQEQFNTPIDIIPLIEKNPEYPLMNIIYCRTCNFYPVSHLPTTTKPTCKRCHKPLEIILAHMKAVGVNSYMTSEIAN